VVGNDAIDLTLNDSSPPNGGVGVEGGGEHHQHQHHQHQHHQQHHQQHEPPRAGQPRRAAQTSIKNWLKPAIRTNDGRSNPSAGWETAAPLFSSSLGGQKKMIMVEEPLPMKMKKKKRKTISQSTTMATTTAKPVGSNVWTGAVKAQPSAMASSVPRNTLDESESGVDIASSTDFKSLRAKWDAAITVDSKKKVLKTITTVKPVRLEYSSEALVELLVLALEMDEINHPEQFNDDKARWPVWVNGRADFHNGANKIHLDSSDRIKREIAGALMVNNANLPQDAVLAEGAFVVENMHMLILIPRNGEPTIHKASEFKRIMEQKGFGKIVEATMMNVSPAPLHQQNLMKSGDENKDCATKKAYLDIFSRVARKAIFDKHKTIDFVFFSVSDLLASIGPKYSTAANDGSIPPEEVFELHVRRKLGNGYAGINGDIVALEVVRTARELGLLCREKNTFIVVNSAKARDVLVKNESQLQVFSERTVAYGCALCCFQPFRPAGPPSCLTMCGLMVQCTLGEVELVASLLKEEGRTAFLEVKNALELTFGEITDECLKELVERSLCYAAEFGAINGDDGPQTFHALLSCFSSKGGKAVHEKQGHLDWSPEFTGFDACKELASKHDWSSEQVRNWFGETKNHGKIFALFKAYEQTQRTDEQPSPSLGQKFRDTPYHKSFAQMCCTERSQLKNDSTPKHGVVHTPVKTLAAIKELKKLAEVGKPYTVSRYAFVAAENSTNEEELVRLKRSIGMPNPSIDKNKWNRTALGYLACKKLFVERGFNADTLHNELRYTTALNIFNSFLDTRGIPMNENAVSGHGFHTYIRTTARKEAPKDTDGNVKEISNFTTLQAIYMLQALAADETLSTSQNVE
jgi:hypothetical protein